MTKKSEEANTENLTDGTSVLAMDFDECYIHYIGKNEASAIA